MQETDQFQVACPNCGKRLRVKAAHEGKRLKCPSCSSLFPVSAEGRSRQQEPAGQASTNPWPLIGTATAGLAAVALLAFLWLGAKSDVRSLREQVTTAQENNQQEAATVEGNKKRLTSQEQLVKQLEAENSNFKARLMIAEKEVGDAGAAAKENAKLLAEAKKQEQAAEAAAAEAKDLLAAAVQWRKKAGADLEGMKKNEGALAEKKPEVKAGAAEPPAVTGNEYKEDNEPGAIKVVDLQPFKARKSQRDVCIVKIEGGDSIGVKHALLYSIYSAKVPEKLKELDPALLKQDFGSFQGGVFRGGQGSVAGFNSYTKKIPNEVLLSLGENQSATGLIGVRVQIWQLKNGKWEPRSKVLEKTLPLE